MLPLKPARPPFQSVELDPIDVRLEARAAEKGIPTLIAPKAASLGGATGPAHSEGRTGKPGGEGRGLNQGGTPRSRMKTLKIELPDYVWVALKKQAAEEMISLRHLIMSALRAQGVAILDADMIEDGRRLR